MKKDQSDSRATIWAVAVFALLILLLSFGKTPAQTTGRNQTVNVKSTRCQAITKAGAQCKNMTKDTTTGLCGTHKRSQALKLERTRK